jgi:hypothetical protein
MHENSDFMTKINEINVELSGNSQRYVNEYCKSESNRKIDSFSTGCCKRRGGGLLLPYVGLEHTFPLMTAVDTLTWIFDEHTTSSAPPSPEIIASSTTMEEMTM